MKQKLSSVELIDAIKKDIANKIGEENAYLLEEKLSIPFRNLEKTLEDIADILNESLQSNLNRNDDTNTR